MELTSKKDALLQKHRPGSVARTERRAGWLFMLPVVLLFLFIRIIPSLYALYLSFTEYSIIQAPEWIGLDNYLNLLQDDEFFFSLKNTLVYTAGTVIPSAALAFGFALLLDSKIRGLGFFRTLYYIPQVASWVAISMIWIYMFNPSFGLVNFLLTQLGIPKLGFFNDPGLAMPSIILVSIWRNLGYDIVIYLSGLQGIPSSYYEAAQVDGANSWEQFRYITWPLLKPTTVFIVIITGIFALQAFDQIYVLTAGGPADATITAVFTIWRQAFQYGRMGYASAMAFVLFIVIFVLSILSMRLSRQAEDD